ncbi:extracellular solute-binding protein, partial [Clavibacter michiganensis]|uniref:extracellular solute-binding protein n=1 Tax=Clavibacter michiganensis TaxID=28447 RepID=UPI00292F63C7
VEDKLSIYSWGEYDAPEVIEAFTKDEGPKVVMDTFNSNEEMIAKLVAAKGTSGYDLVVPTGVFIPQMIENGLLAKLNLDLIPIIEHMAPAFLGRDWDPKNEYSICKAWGTTGFVYDKTVITRELKTWSDFIDAAKNEA